ncbi:MAG TPA: pyrimidine/purine nucleoside phosphorylase [Bacteroidales bacterium]|nr:pyrimidine/purine nucleoside phosphorylase [Bacteroidales bacterium]HSA42296.1 pyrimidine/purine nucleoside phosphorylase [Bacteroidales bacterium]
MLKVNEYFDGRVKSIALENEEGKATIGVMEAGEYEFGTATEEEMTVVSGSMRVLLPGETRWQTFSMSEVFIVQANQTFRLRIEKACAYKCIYR